MWPFRKRTRQQEVIDLFGKYIDKDALKRLERGTPSDPAPPTKRRIAFVIVLVRDDTAEETQRHLGQVLTTLHEFGGRFETVLSSMAMFVFGGLPDAEYDTAYTQTVSDCARAVLGELGPNAKVVYGQATCLEGGLWTQPYPLFCVTIPEFGKVISALVSLEFGSSLNMELP
ncbi:hypothetical protein SAMN05444161_5985 [Rhizobiales bacterium GAS191]|jgi:hypothetical protein|nr:hypothetical protein SAMN05444161_5985 [Rhizobiales bacterium GAS191]